MRRAVAFLTPVGGAALPDGGAVAWFPLVGALIGLAVGTVWWVADRAFPAAVAAGLAVAADLVLTGLLHMDGLVDSADGLLPPLDRERRLEVMADPRVGAFGVATAFAVLLLRWAALASRRPDAWLVAALWCASRTAMGVALRTLPYARARGLASAFQGGRRGGLPVAALGLALAGGLAGSIGVVPGLAAVAAVLVGAGLVIWFALRRLGGFTGDVLGAAGVIGETAGLVVAAARW